jgi:hypothetical protein
MLLKITSWSYIKNVEDFWMFMESINWKGETTEVFSGCRSPFVRCKSKRVFSCHLSTSFLLFLHLLREINELYIRADARRKPSMIATMKYYTPMNNTRAVIAQSV